MSFYHILSSNTSPNTFPENHTSLYNTPMSNADVWNGHWEVAILSMSHSNCINTFNHDTLTVLDETGKQLNIRTPTKFVMDHPTETFTTDELYLKEIIRRLNAMLVNVIEFKVNQRDVSYKFLSNMFHVYLSSDMSNGLKIHNVLTHYDRYTRSIYNMTITKNSLRHAECYVILIPVNTTREVIPLKAKK